MSETLPDISVEAKALGWAPLEEWRGDPSIWVDAEEFVRRGHSVMPILKQNNKELVSKLSATQGELLQVKAALSEMSESVKALTTFQATEVKRQVEAKVDAIRAELREARRSGDEERVDALEDRLDTAKDELKAVPTPAPASSPTSAPTPEPWAVAFAEENKDWFGSGPGKDRRRTAMLLAIADELKETTALRGGPLLAKAKEEMERQFAGTGSPPKAEGGSSSGGGAPPSSPNARTYAALPPEAKTACDQQERQMVGPKKPFKTQAEWRKYYADIVLAT